jgi:CRP/FNR family transcriptional regulator, nitrogen fixation regulation protein
MLALSHHHPSGSAIVDLLAACEPRFDGDIVSCVRGQEILGEGDPAKNFFLVLKGLFRGVRTTPDGRRQVFAFYMAGDLCGLESGESHKLAVEAVDIAEMAILPRQTCRRWMRESPEIGAALFDAAAFALTLTVDHMMMIGCGLAEERLAWFLTVRAPRLVGPDTTMVDLAMRRQDIADYLALTIETVSRTLTLFKEQNLIKIHKLSRVEILRPDVLARLSAVDREVTRSTSRTPGSRTH